jgi:hypothetical protein
MENAGLCHKDANVYFGREASPFYLLSSSDPPISGGEIDVAVENAVKLRSVYKPDYEFPKWTIEKLPQVYADLASKCRVYYSDGNENDAGLLMTQREPVNIAMKRYYDRTRLKQLFGWDMGYYGKFFKTHKKLAPNIAIYCPTLVKLENDFKRVHVINAIGYAFDSNDQPDFQYFKRQRDIYGSNSSASELYDRYKRVFAKIYRCARDIGANSIVMSLVGGGVFSELWPGLLDKIWWPALKRVWEDNQEIRLLFMGPEDSGLPNNVGLFPQNLRHPDIDLNKTLFVNAWDPWSIAGNGNSMDNSLDGHMGRNSMIAVLTWPLTNLILTKTTLIKVESVVGGANVTFKDTELHTIQINILKHLDPKTVLSLCSTDPTYRRFCNNKYVWDILLKHHFPNAEVTDDPRSLFQKLTYGKITKYYYNSMPQIYKGIHRYSERYWVGFNGVLSPFKKTKYDSVFEFYGEPLKHGNYIWTVFTGAHMNNYAIDDGDEENRDHFYEDTQLLAYDSKEDAIQAAYYAALKKVEEYKDIFPSDSTNSEMIWKRLTEFDPSGRSSSFWLTTHEDEEDAMDRKERYIKIVVQVTKARL